MKSRVIAAIVVGLFTLVGLVLVVDRGGVFAWGILVIGALLLMKLAFKPSTVDLPLGIGFIVVSAVAWAGTFYYVISQYEAAEVVELTYDTKQGSHTVRLWVMDIDGEAIVYYDADPFAAEELLAGSPVQFERHGEVTTRIPQTTLVSEMSDEEANPIYGAMADKYGDLLSAADISYLFLGSGRDRVAVIARLPKD